MEEGTGKGEGGQIWWKYYLFMCENGTRPVEAVLIRGEGRRKEKDGRGNLTKLYYKHFCRCHSVHYANK
jgi:hypothetical protein